MQCVLLHLTVWLQFLSTQWKWAPLVQGDIIFWAARLTCYQVKFSFILLADAQAYYYITGTNSCLCCVNHMNITQSRFSPSHLVLAHFLRNEVCSHKKAKQNKTKKGMGWILILNSEKMWSKNILIRIWTWYIILVFLKPCVYIYFFFLHNLGLLIN